VGEFSLPWKSFQSSLSSCEALQKAIEEEKRKSEILPSRLQASDLPRKLLF